MDAPKYEVRVTLTGDDWRDIQHRLWNLWDELGNVGRQQRPRRVTGCDDRGVTYTVDVSEVEVVSEPPRKVGA